ncbi:MAG: hypothetical protein ACRCZP_01290 [Phycicoccus sp.]
MPVITGGNVIRNTTQTPGTKPRMLSWSGVPTGTTYAGVVAVGDLVCNVLTGHVYEYTEPAAVPTYTRVDTV